MEKPHIQIFHPIVNMSVLEFAQTVASLFRLIFENIHFSHKKLGKVKVKKDDFFLILSGGQLQLIKPNT